MQIEGWIVYDDPLLQFSMLKPQVESDFGVTYQDDRFCTICDAEDLELGIEKEEFEKPKKVTITINM